MKRIVRLNLWQYSPIILAIAVVCLTALAWYSIEKTSKQRNSQYFDNLVSDTSNNLHERYVLYRQSLLGGLGIFYASLSVERSEWRKYVETLQIEETLPGISGLGYIDYVEQKGLEAYLEKIRADQAPEFQNKPDTEFKDKFVIRYIEPEPLNSAAVGLDIGFEKNRRDAAEYARDYGIASLTKKIELVQDNEKQPGFLLLVPVYEGNSVPDNISNRRSKLLGWVYAPFIGKNFLQDLTKVSKNQIAFTKTTKVEVGERIWTIEWAATEIFAVPGHQRLLSVLSLLGFPLALILYFSLNNLIQNKRYIAKEIKKQTQQLKKSKEFLGLIMNSIPDLVFVKDKNFKIVRSNQSFLNLFPPDKRNKVIGYTTAESFTKEESDKFFSQDRIAFENGIAQTYEKITLYTGETMNLFTTKARFYDENGEEFILCIGRDVTDLIETQRDLEKKVEERTAEYKKQKQIAEKAGNAKEDFLANMSHELRTPLNSIIGLTKILIDEGGFNQEQHETLEVVDKASQNLLRTVNDILDISKMEAGKVKLENTNMNLAGLMHSLIDQIKPLASQKGLEVRENLQDMGDLYVNADEHRISRILTNLIGNAIKYTDDGYVKVHFETNENKKDVLDFVVTVTDTGIGISKEKIETIFDKFAQADKSTERLYGGTGLGLSITKKLVDLMKGSITVESEVGKGSVFTLRLPLKKGEVEKATKETLSDKQKKLKNIPHIELSNAKILVAEDHEFNQVFIKKILSRLGVKNFIIANNGAEALAKFKKETFDLVLMDYHMPRMNGYVTTENIRQYEASIQKDFNTPIIAMTADVMPGTEEKCLKAGMNDYISKPVAENILREKIQKWLLIPNDIDEDIEILGKDEVEDDGTYFDLHLLEDYTDGDVQAQKELIQIFYSKSKADIGILKKNCVDGESQKWVEAAHSLKGSSSYISANTLKNFCAIAQSLDDSSKEERLDLYKKIKKTHEKLCDALKEKGLLGD